MSHNPFHDPEVYRCLEEAANNFAALLFLLMDKEVFTHEEFEAAKVRMRSEMDQAMAKRRDTKEEKP